ncbi:MAG: S41 family peptidase [Candidatus Omnitrophica bacterium]|nr:S41 family peptidase [Candidatus Omnitrophota bacterium]
MIRKYLLLPVVLGTILFTAPGAMIGLEKSAAEKPESPEKLYNQVELFADAVSIIRNEYVDAVDSKKLIYGAMQGMLGSLDDYSQFMDPDEYNEIRVETKGEFGGIGVEISLKDGILTVITPMVGTPAYLGGVRAGDKIVKIDGKVTKNITLNDAVKQMRGKPGTIVTLTIWREGLPNILDIPIKRDMIKINSVKRADIIADKIGYIKLIEFQENTPRDLDAAIKKLKASGMKSLILDLRNNPGGLLDGAIDVSERFLAKDELIVSIRSRTQDRDVLFKSSGKTAHTDFPLILIVNEGSASASEIVAGAIKDNKRGIVLGMKTYGKASVQTVIPLKDGSALRFTTAYYLTPSGKLIKDDGIVPDVIIERMESAAKGKDKGPDIFEGLEEAEPRTVPPTGRIGVRVKDDNSMKDKPSEKTSKPVVTAPEMDNQLEAAVNLMKAISIYDMKKS